MKVVIVSTFALATNYSRDLGVSLRKVADKKDVIFLCGKKGEKAADNDPPKIDQVWTPGWLFFFDVLSYVFTKHPNIVHLQQEFKLYGNIISNILFPWLVLLIRFSGSKSIVTIHGVIDPKLVDTAFPQFNLPQNRVTKTMVYLYLFYVYFLIGRFARSIVVLAPALGKILTQYYKVPAKKVNVIKIGIQEIENPELKPKDSPLYQKFPEILNKEIILVFGYFSPRKGFELLVESFSRALKNPQAKKWLMVLAGNVKPEFIPYKQSVEKIIQKLGAEKHVLITDYLEDIEIDHFYRLSKVGVVPAIFSLSASGALSLALSYLKPLLFADLKPGSSEIQEGNLGSLYNPFDPKSFAQKLEKIMTDKKVYKEYYKALVKEAPSRCWSKTATDHYQLYQQLMQGSKFHV